MSIKLYIEDEIKGHFYGLSRDAKNAVYEKLKKRPKGFFQTSAYKLGRWDGFSCHFDKINGSFYIYQLEDILEELSFWIDIDQIEIIDSRKSFDFPFPYINENFLEETGNELRDYQIEAIEIALEKGKGVLEIATAGGKTLISGGIVKALDQFLPSITIVPSNKLVTQTYDVYNQLDIGPVGKIDQKTKNREETIKNNQHIVVTWQTLKNIKDLFGGFEGLVIHDEIHNFSDVAIDLWENIFNYAPYRIGMTGTLPKDDNWKRETIFCRLGENVIKHINDSELRNKGFISQIEIEMVPVYHPAAESEAKEYSKRGEWFYESEFNYLTSNQARIQGISDFIQHLPVKNTLVLGHAAFIEQLAKQLQLDYVHQKTKHDEREKLFQEFENRNDFILPASFGTSSVGISVDKVYRLILIDPGKSNILVSQSLGRGLRLDGVYNKVEVIDIYSNMLFSVKHKKEREKLYREKEINYYDSNQKIVI